MRYRIKTQPNSLYFSITDADTGKEIENVTRVEFVADVGGLPVLRIDLICMEVEIEHEGIMDEVKHDPRTDID